MKKILMAILAISFSSLVFASGDMFVKPTNYFDGAYIGIGGGVSHTTADASANATNVVNFYSPPSSPLAGADPILVGSQSDPMSLNSDLGEIMGAGEVFAGFGKSFNIQSNRNNFYLGLELFGKYTPTDMQDSSNTTISQTVYFREPPETQAIFIGNLSSKLENNYSFGGDLRFGYLITPKTMIYILAGLDIAQFEYTVNSSATIELGDSQTSNLVTNSLSDNETSWKYGFMPGIGIETMITDNLSLRAQYTYTIWGDGDFGIDGSTSKPIDLGEKGVTGVFNSALSGDADNIQRGLFTIDLTWHFNGL